MTVELQLESALSFGFDALSAAFSASFEGYTVSMKLDAAALESRARSETWDLGSSFLARRGSEVVGTLFISRRGTSARVAAMGVTPLHRRTGVGRAMMQRCIEDSRARGDTRFVLEVLEVNRAAEALYESFGFTRVRRLLGFECKTPAATGRSPDFGEIDLAELATRAYAWQEPHLPWQSDAATLANLSPPARAFALRDRAVAVVIEADRDPLVLRAMLVRPDLRRRGHGSALWAELAALYPARSWRTSFALPEGLMDGFLLAHGFTTAALAQWEMIYG